MNDLVQQLSVDLNARVASVDAARALAEGPLGDLPPNIYAARGEWEALSTPSRDARLRASVRTIYAFVKDNAETPDMVRSLGQVWREHEASASCEITYTNDAGAPEKLTLDDVIARIYDLSFDPYHCPEMRWGAYPSPAARSELATCANADDEHLARWHAERRNRNVIDRPSGIVETGPDFGPDTPEDIDVPALFRRLGLR
jgi:hypothetical protein